MSQIMFMFRESGIMAAVILLWFLCSITLCVLLSVYYIMMEYREPGPSAIFGGGLASSLIGIVTAVVLLVAIPLLIDFIAGAAFGVSRSVLDSAAPENRAALLARSISMQINIPTLTMLGQLILSIPLAVMTGLSLSVPFRRKRRLEAAGMGGGS